MLAHVAKPLLNRDIATYSLADFVIAYRISLSFKVGVITLN